MGIRFDTGLLQALNSFINVLRVYHVVVLFTERICCPLKFFYLNRFCSDFRGLIIYFFLTNIKTLLRIEL